MQQQQVAKPSAKKPYTAPKLSDLGSIGQVTEGGIPGYGSGTIVRPPVGTLQ